MSGVIYVACTNVGRSIINAHLAFHKSIPILAIFNLSSKKAKSKATYDNLIFKDKKDIPLIFVNSINTRSNIKIIKKLKPNLIIQVGWSEKFNNEILMIPKYGCIGHHPSPLPKYRGAAVLNWAIILGIKNWGNSFFLMNDKFDDGMVIYTKSFRIENLNINSLYENICELSYDAIKINLKNWYVGKFKKIYSKKKISYLRKRTPQDGQFVLSDKAINIYRLIKALLKPFPNAFFIYKNKKIYISDVKFVKNFDNRHKIGIINIYDKDIEVMTGDNKVLRLLDIYEEE